MHPLIAHQIDEFGSGNVIISGGALLQEAVAMAWGRIGGLDDCSFFTCGHQVVLRVENARP